MHLSRSLTLWLAGTTAVVLGLHGWVQARQERWDLNQAARRELALAGTAIRSGVESALRDGQLPDVRNLLEQLELSDPAVDVFVFDGDGRLIASSWGSEPTRTLASAIARRPGAPRVPWVEELPDDGGLLAVAPFRGSGAHQGHVVIVRPIEGLLADLATERRAVAVSIVLLVAALSLTLSLVVRQRVHRPMKRLVAGIRRAAEGEFSGRVGMTGRDELAEIAREFDKMVAALDEARRRLAWESDQREQLEIDMQHANKLATVGQLAAMLAHEIGSPLQVLNGRARALAARADLAPDARQSAEVLVDQTDRVDRIVQRLLGIARRKPAVSAMLDLREAVKLVVELVSGEARRRGVRVDLELADVPQVRAVADHVQQVALNLLQNALRASAGGGAVRVEVSPASFERLPAAARVTSVALVVEDSGKGISEQVAKRIFEPFFTAWESDGGAGGTGLGLSVVKSLVDEYGGAVTVGAGAGERGTRVTVHFPVGEPAAGGAAGVVR